MAVFGTVTLASAPAKVAKVVVNDRMKEYESFIDMISAKGGNFVGTINVSGSEKIKGASMSAKRAAKRLGVVAETWTVGNTVYVSLK